jgi:hypothetical protein
MHLDVSFASPWSWWPGLAVIGALAVVIVWKRRAICRTSTGIGHLRQERVPADLVPVLSARRP